MAVERSYSHYFNWLRNEVTFRDRVSLYLRHGFFWEVALHRQLDEKANRFLREDCEYDRQMEMKRREECEHALDRAWEKMSFSS